MKVVDANQKDQPNDMNDQQHKQPWRKSNQLTVEAEDDVSAMALNRKAVIPIKNSDNTEPLRITNPGGLKGKGRRLIHIKPSQGNELIIEEEDDELIQRRRKRVDEFVSQCSRRS